MSVEAIIREMREILERPETTEGVELREGFGTDYWIVLDGEAVTDPRSLQQPAGVHEASRVFDPEPDGTEPGRVSCEGVCVK